MTNAVTGDLSGIMGYLKKKKKNYLGFGIEFNFKGLVFEWYLYCELN